MTTENVKYAWYSNKAAEEVGYAVWRTPDGRVIVVTYVSDNPSPRDSRPGNAHIPPFYSWKDTIYQGEVVSFVKSFIDKRL